MLHNAQFVSSSKNFKQQRRSILTYVRDESPSSTLMDKIVRNLTPSNRLIIKGNKYFYQPSEEYIRFIAKFKRKK
jgi:hypothetical protein